MSFYRFEEKFSLMERDAAYLEEYIRRYGIEKESAGQKLWFRSEAIARLVVNGIRFERVQGLLQNCRG
jgi:hypothetical protein